MASAGCKPAIQQIANLRYFLAAGTDRNNHTLEGPGSSTWKGGSAAKLPGISLNSDALRLGPATPHSRGPGKSEHWGEL
jgi:hypothetical protein